MSRNSAAALKAPGRNDPCPCGSGRKYKRCCLAVRSAEESARLRLRAVEGRVTGTLLRYAMDSWGKPLLLHAWDDFWNYPEDDEFEEVDESEGTDDDLADEERGDSGDLDDVGHEPLFDDAELEGPADDDADDPDDIDDDADDFDDPDDIGEIVETEEFVNMFVPWYLTGFVPDPAIAEEQQGMDGEPDWPQQPIGLEWLAIRTIRAEASNPAGVGGSKTAVPESDRDFIEAACRSTFSVYVVERATPGSSLDLRDILTGSRFHVLDQSASEKAQRADLLFARIATVAGTSIMYGAGPYLVPPSWHVPVLDWRDRTFGSDKVTAQGLEDFDIEIRDLYFWIRDELSHPRPPALANTDGEPIVMTTLTFELTTTLGDACEKLTSLATVDGDFHGEVNRDPSGVVTSATLNWTKAGNQRMRALPSTLLGTLRLDGGRLVAEVNSSERAKRLKDEIATRLGEAARLVETKVTDLGEEIEKRRAGKGDLPSRDDGTFAYPELAARIEATTKQMADRHWDEWLDTPLPALRDQTPREAARSGGGRERLEALLAEFERRDLDGARNLFGVTPHLKDIRVKLGLTNG